MTRSLDLPWWEHVPLSDGRRRDLADLHPNTVRNLVNDALILARRAVRNQRQPLQKILGDGDDLDQQLTEWILEAAATYDPTRSPWGAHVVQRVRQLAGDHWRRILGRTALNKVRRFNAAGGMKVSNHERLQVSRALALLPGGQSPLDDDTYDIVTSPCPDDDLALRAEGARVTRTLFRAANATEPGRQKRLYRGLAIHLLRTVHGYSQRNIAECGIHHRTAATLENEFRSGFLDLLDPHS